MVKFENGKMKVSGTINLEPLFYYLAGEPEPEIETQPLKYDNGYIEKSIIDGREYYDLKTDFGTPCMDGETCEILETNFDEDYILLQEETEKVKFKLSMAEFEVAAQSW